MSNDLFRLLNIIVLSGDSVLRTILYNNKFDQVICTKSVFETKQLLNDNNMFIDILFIDELYCDTVPEFIYKIRHVDLGVNPFLIIVVITKDTSNIPRLLKYGASAVLLRPLTISSIMKKIKPLVEKNKIYVISDDYVGPSTGQSKGIVINVPDITERHNKDNIHFFKFFAKARLLIKSKKILYHSERISTFTRLYTHTSHEKYKLSIYKSLNYIMRNSIHRSVRDLCSLFKTMVDKEKNKKLLMLFSMFIDRIIKNDKDLDLTDIIHALSKRYKKATN